MLELSVDIDPQRYEPPEIYRTWFVFDIGLYGNNKQHTCSTLIFVVARFFGFTRYKRNIEKFHPKILTDAPVS